MDGTVAVVGGGVIGLSAAIELSEKFEHVFVLEKQPRIPAENQSTHNSGVIHSGIYYPPGTLKAQFSREGVEYMYDFCQYHEVQHRQTGKLVVAKQGEEEKLEELRAIAQANGVETELMSRWKARHLEPRLNAASALYVPRAGVVDAASFYQTLLEVAWKKGVNILPDNNVIGIERSRDGFEVHSETGGRESSAVLDVVVNTAGIYADEVSKMLDPESPYEIIPMRGEYAKFRGELGMNIYPAPHGIDENGERVEGRLEDLAADGTALTLGVHLTPTLDGHVLAGPSYVRAKLKDDDAPVRDIDFFRRQVSHYFEVPEEMWLEQTGMKAQLKGTDDFLIEEDSGFVNVLGTSSPGLSYCIKIGKYVAEMF